MIKLSCKNSLVMEGKAMDERELVIGKEPKTKLELMMHRILVFCFLSFVFYNMAVRFGWL